LTHLMSLALVPKIPTFKSQITSLTQKWVIECWLIYRVNRTHCESCWLFLAKS